MKTNEFNYELPERLIAQHPADRRDGSRMMVLFRDEGRWEHRQFSDLPNFLKPHDVLVVNNTRVIPARMIGKKQNTGGRIEVFLLEETEPRVWKILMKASSRRPAPGEKIIFDASERSAHGVGAPPGGAGTPCTRDVLTATMISDGEMGEAIVRFETDRPVVEWAEELGDTPLPPYINREAGSLDEDRERYQTVFARHPGAVAAPTAGLHFTPELFDKLSKQDIQKAEVTLHVGLGTFRPVSAENVEEHLMEEERYVISDDTARAIRKSKDAGGRIVAVGSTSVRTLETVAAQKGEITAGEGRTDIFIYPPYSFKAADVILTNFHLPKSTLLMMMSAFAGRELMLDAYAEAVREEYRFFSYGDCMLIV